jgi:protein-disulfide isomerase
MEPTEATLYCVNNMRLTSESKILLAVIAVTIGIIAVAAILMTRPAPALTRENLIPADAHTKGNPKAQVYLVEFSDFQCSACAAFKPIVDQIINNNKEKLLFAHRHYPLPQNLLAQKAAQATEAAGQAGKFWEMFDLIFANSANLTEPMLFDFAHQLGLDEEQFAADLKNGTYISRVQEDIAAGEKLGLNATPTFFLNGKKLKLTNFTDLSTAVEQAINK